MLSSMYLNIFQPTKHHSLMCLLFRLWSRRWTGWGCWWTSRTAPCRPRWTRWRWAQQLNTCCRYFMYKQCNVCILYQHIIFTHHIYCVYKNYLHIFVHIISVFTSNIYRIYTIYLHTISTQVSTAPVIFSHSSAQHICNSTRNVPDHLLKKTVS